MLGGVFDFDFLNLKIKINDNNSYFLFVNYSFGKRSGVSIRRPNECLILEPSEMLVVSSVSCTFRN